jgi:hypothetical protein
LARTLLSHRKMGSCSRNVSTINGYDHHTGPYFKWHVSNNMIFLRTSTVVDKKRHGTEPLRLLTRSNLHDLVYGSMLRTRLLSVTCTNRRTRRKKMKY